jgi:DNA-binding transcriptional ArsR family regulator
MSGEQFFDILKAMADESRYKIISILLKRDLCVGGLAKQLCISKPAVSQHLQILRKTGLVTGEKRGYYTHYGVNRTLLIQFGEKSIEIAKAPENEKCSREQTGKCDC